MTCLRCVTPDKCAVHGCCPGAWPAEPRFQKTYCSQCGDEFGPGDQGYSHCSDHAEPLSEDCIIELGRQWSNSRFATGAAAFLIDLARAIEREHGIGSVRHCGSCADGVPGGPDKCSACGRNQQYSHWTPAEIAHEEVLACEQAQDMQRRAEDNEHALDPDDEPQPTPAHTCVNAGTSAGACKTHCGDKLRCWGTG